MLEHDVSALVRDERSAPFFDAAAEGRLMLRFSPSSEEWCQPAAVVCETTYADDLEWREASGRGQVVSWTVIPKRPGDDGAAPAPTVVAIVELEEGPWLPLQVAERPDPGALRTGLPVQVRFVHPEGGDHVPVAVLA